MVEQAESCPWCGEADLAGGDACVRCRGTLLVDVVVAAPVAEPRERFYAARLVSQLGLSFAEVKDALGKGGVIATSVRRSAAQQIVAALGGAGVTASYHPHAASARRRIPRAALGGALATVVLVVVAAVLSTRGAPRPAPATVAAPAAAVPADPGRLTIQEVGKRALESVATLSCGNVMGAGFFVEAEELVTNAHVTCDTDDTLSVQMRDGRTLLGTVESRDRVLDLARVRVVGAQAPALPVGQAADLQAGDRVVFIGSPHGMAFTLHEGRVSYVGRALFGVGYLQLNGDVNPGNSGGPVLDAGGRVVGIVSLKVESADGIGLALPIEYAVPPSSPEGLTSWNRVLQDVEAQDQREVARYRLDIGEARLVAVDTSQGQALPVVLERWDGAPHATSERYELRRGAARVCSGTATFRRWLAIGDSVQGRNAQLLRWLERSAVSQGLQVGVGELDEGCPLPQLLEGGDLVLVRDGGELGSARLQLDAGAARLREMQRRTSAVQRRQADAQAEQQEAVREQWWRRHFAEANARVADVDRNAERARADITRLEGAMLRRGAIGLRGDALARYQKAKEYLDNLEQHRAEAEEALRELERQAANDDVPLEWRR